MTRRIKLKKGSDLNLAGCATGTVINRITTKNYAIIPDDYNGIVPKPEVKEGDKINTGQSLYYDKNNPEIKITSPVTGEVVFIKRGERRKIEAIVISSVDTDIPTMHDIGSCDVSSIKSILLQSGLWAYLRQRPYDRVPSPHTVPRDIFITAFDSAPLAPDFQLLLKGKEQYLQKGIEVLSKLTAGKVYIGFPKHYLLEFNGAESVIFDAPHPAGNVGVQIANIRPVNKGETIWSLDAVTLSRIGELFITGKVPYETTIAVTGSEVKTPQYISTRIGASIKELLKDNIIDSEETPARIISGNVLTGIHESVDGFLRYPYRQITVIPEIEKKDEFMGWASLSPTKFSMSRSFTHWLLRRKKPTIFDARINGGERAIIMAGEYDKMLPMDIYAEFLIKAIIAFDIDKMEALGIYEVAPEDFALCEFVDTSKLELQRIVREGLDHLYKELN